MTTQALKALKLSIAHWQRLASGKRDEYEYPVAADCPLCQEFAMKNKARCDGCPVFEATGEHGCVHTPYVPAALEQCENGVDSPQFRAAAKNELAFLKSLLPKKGKNASPKK